MGLYVLNSFVQLSKVKYGTPEYAEYVAFTLRRHQNILRKQLYLQNHGVSFSYTDTKSYKQIEDLIKVCQEMDEELQNVSK